MSLNANLDRKSHKQTSLFVHFNFVKKPKHELGCAMPHEKFNIHYVPYIIQTYMLWLVGYMQFILEHFWNLIHTHTHTHTAEFLKLCN